MNILNLFKGFNEQNKIRIVAFGSSVVERTVEGTHWFDCLDIALAREYGRIHQCLNCGHGGDTSRDLLMRIDAEVSPFKPNLTFIKIGGNDTDPSVDLGPTEFKNNIKTINKKLRTIGSKIVLMTYHLPLRQFYGIERIQKLQDFMSIIREVAHEDNTYLIDDMKFWTQFSSTHAKLHRKLIQDDVHLNRLGNLFLGLCLIDNLGLDVRIFDPIYCQEAIQILKSINESLKSS